MEFYGSRPKKQRANSYCDQEEWDKYNQAPCGCSVVYTVVGGFFGVCEPAESTRRFYAETMPCDPFQRSSRCESFTEIRLSDSEFHFLYCTDGSGHWLNYKLILRIYDVRPFGSMIQYWKNTVIFVSLPVAAGRHYGDYLLLL